MEFWDLYDKHRNLTGEKIKSGDPLPKDKFRLVVHICIFNSSGKMLIQQRQSFKEGWPNLWDVSAGGRAQSGDTSQMAMERETFEELGLKLDLKDSRPELTINFPQGFDDFYIIEKDLKISDLKLQVEEVKAAKWATKEEIYQMIDKKTFIPYHKSFIDLIFHMREGMGFLSGGDKIAKGE